MEKTKEQLAAIAIAEKYNVSLEVVEKLLYYKANGMGKEYKKLINEIAEGQHNETSTNR